MTVDVVLDFANLTYPTVGQKCGGWHARPRAIAEDIGHTVWHICLTVHGCVGYFNNYVVCVGGGCVGVCVGCVCVCVCVCLFVCLCFFKDKWYIYLIQLGVTKIACSCLARNDFPFTMFTFFTYACQFDFEWARLLWQSKQWSIRVNYGVYVLGNIGLFSAYPARSHENESNLWNLDRHQQPQSGANLV